MALSVRQASLGALGARCELMDVVRPGCHALWPQDTPHLGVSSCLLHRVQDPQGPFPLLVRELTVQATFLKTRPVAGEL